MILADTCIWVDHVAAGDPVLIDLLVDQEILIHPFVVGEFFLGNVRDRSRWHGLLTSLPEFLPVRPGDVLALIENHKLAGSGVGYVDTHLLASVLALPGALFWTRDKRLRGVARELGIDAGLA